MPKSQPVRPLSQSPARRRLTPIAGAQRTDEQRELLSGVLGEDAPNVFSTLVRHPALYRKWLPFCLHLLTDSAFPARERELVIIRTASLCECAYELHHHVGLGSEVGLTDHELAALTGETTVDWSTRDRLLLAAIDQLHASHTIRETTWHALSALLNTEQLIELPVLVGHYVLLAGTLNSLGVPLDSARAEPHTVQYPDAVK
ncbi:carboxymuconolactone decarboxylase family protein [Streptomyces sp. NPDC090798]|uniref:carboxymuconolactone decarboxylase family protein n=1 Tax=Streptomyces sp. NPDC090798 TaxID=3365968 RepID=UPI00380C127E